MAKKKKKKPGAGAKSGKNKGQRLEDKLKGYWKKGQWGEFITLYVRQWERACQTHAAEHWDPAVYNLLHRTLFQEQDLATLVVVLQTLDQAKKLSEENRACLQVARATLSASRGELYQEDLHQLPESLPAPFATLKKKLAAIVEAPPKSPLPEYLSGRRSKARKGEKQYALLARLYHTFQKLQEQDFQPESITQLTNWGKLFFELDQYLKANLGYSGTVFQDAAILADWIRDMRKAPHRSRNPGAVAAFLKQRKFSYSAHPFVIRLLETAIGIGSGEYGRQWAIELRASLQNRYPALLSNMPESTEAQMEVWNTCLFQERGRGFDAKLLSRMLDKLLEAEVWSRRERLILHLAQLTIVNAAGRMLFQNEYALFRLNHLELAREAKLLLSLSVQACIEGQRMYQELYPDTKKPLGLILELFEDSLDTVPLVESSELLFKAVRSLIDLELPGTTVLHLLNLAFEVQVMGKKNPIQEFIVQKKAPISLRPEEISAAVQDVKDHPHLFKLFRVWTKCLEPDSLQALTETLLLEKFEQACVYDPDEEDFLSVSLFGQQHPWFDIPKDLLEQARNIVDPDFPLLGLISLSVQSSDRDRSPMPKGAKQARAFLENPPPNDVLMKMILWMLSWHSTPYKNQFLHTLILKIKEHITTSKAWLRLAEEIRENRQRKLASMLWDSWDELDFFADLHSTEDFREARDHLRPMVQRSSRKQPKKQPARPSQTLLDLIEKNTKD